MHAPCHVPAVSPSPSPTWQEISPTYLPLHNPDGLHRCNNKSASNPRIRIKQALFPISGFEKFSRGFVSESTTATTHLRARYLQSSSQKYVDTVRRTFCLVCFYKNLRKPWKLDFHGIDRGVRFHTARMPLLHAWKYLSR